MKAQCEKCREIVELVFTVAPGGGGIEVVCPACKGTYVVEEQRSRRNTEDAERSEDAEGEKKTGCPKCGAPRGEAEACRKCGLVFARWSGTAGGEVAPELVEAVKAAAGLWAACEAGWGESARHDAFVAHCQKTGAYAFAAGRYRAAQAERGAAAEPAAGQALEKIRKSAEAAMVVAAATRRSDPDTNPYRNTVILLVMLLVLAVGGMFWAIVRKSSKPDGAAPAVRQPVERGPRTPVPRRP